MGRFAAVAALREVFTNSNLRRLQLAWAGFMLADSAYGVALAILAFAAGGAGAVGIVMVCRLLPAALATPAVTVYGDRHRGERVLAVTLAARASVIATLAAVALSDFPLAALYALVAIDTVATTAVRPLIAALAVPASRSPRELSAANSASSMIDAVSVLCGPLLAVALLAGMNEASVFLAAAILLLGAALTSTRIHIPGERVRGSRTGDAMGAAGFKEELAAVVRVLGAVPRSGLVLGLFSAQALVKGMWMVFTPVVAIELLDTGSTGVGALQAALGAGGVVGALGTLALVGRRRLTPPFALGLALWGPPIAFIALVPDPVLALCLVGVLGAGRGLVYVAGLSLLQRMMEKEVLGRVLGLLQTLALVATGVGAILAPTLIAAAGLRTALVSSAILMPVLVAAAWPRFGAIDRSAVANEREVLALRRVPLFSPLAPLELEQLAAATIALTRPAGSEVVRQGDRGDRFYVVADGELEVFVDGRSVATLEPGGSFGEIALLRDVPRTASVRALSDVELYALDHDDFLSALTGRRPGSTPVVDGDAPATASAAGDATDSR